MPVSVTSYVVRVLYGPRQPRCRYLDRGNHVPVIYVDTVDLVHIFGSVHIRLTIRTSSPNNVVVFDHHFHDHRSRTGRCPAFAEPRLPPDKIVLDLTVPDGVSE